jgi:RecB family exonuclease
VSFKNDHLSVSRIGRYESCPLSFRFHYIDKLAGEPGDALRFGVLIHLVLEQLLGEVIAAEHTGPLSETRAFELLRAAWPKSGLTGVEVFTEALAILRAFVREEGVVDHMDVLAVEQPFELPVGPFSVVGRIDRVDRVDDGTVRVTDYKSNRLIFTREEVDSSLQLSLYAAVAKRLWPWAKRVELCFHMLRHSVKLTTERTEEQLQAALGYIEAVGRATEEAEDFPPRLGPNCIYCDHQQRCPAYADAIAGKRRELSADPADLEAVGREREELAAMVKILDARKGDLDKVLKAHLKTRDELVLAGVRYAIFRASKTSYPLAATLDAVARATGKTRDEIIARVANIDKDALDALVKELGAQLDKAKVLMLRAELEAVADKTLLPRLWAKQVQG